MKIARTSIAVFVLLMTATICFAGDIAGAKRAFAAHKTMAVVVLEPALISGDSETAADVMYYLGEFKKANPAIPVFTLSSEEYMRVFFGPPMIWKNAAVFIKPNGDGLVIPSYILDAAIYDDAARWLAGKKPQHPDASWLWLPVQAQKR